MTNVPFTPGATASLAVTTTTGSVALGKPDGTRQVRVANVGPNEAYVKFGDSTVEAATTDMPIHANTSDIFTVGPGITHIAGISAATESAALRITSGHGE